MDYLLIWMLLRRCSGQARECCRQAETRYYQFLRGFHCDLYDSFWSQYHGPILEQFDSMMADRELGKTNVTPLYRESDAINISECFHWMLGCSDLECCWGVIRGMLNTEYSHQAEFNTLLPAFAVTYNLSLARLYHFLCGFLLQYSRNEVCVHWFSL